MALIDKETALNALMEERKHLLANGQPGAEHILTHYGYNVIDELPPVQPKRGKWIDMPYVPSHTEYMCSECGKTIYTNSEYIKEHKYCFSCGAKMER